MKRTDNQKHHKYWIWWSILAIGTVVIVCVAGYMAGGLSTVSKNSQSAPQTPVKILLKLIILHKMIRIFKVKKL